MKFNHKLLALSVLMAAAGKEASAGGSAKTKPASDVAVADPKSTALAVGGINFEEDAGRGTEGVDKDSQAIPFITVLQGLSPAIADGTVAGARVGQYINTVTNELFDTLVVVPIGFQRRFVEWAPRKAGGGYKGEHTALAVESGEVGYKAPSGQYLMGDPEADEKARELHNLLKDTRTHFVLAIRPDGTFFPALFPLSSTQIKKSKKWITMILGVQLRNGKGELYNPASFSHMYKLGSVKESNDQGTWQGVTIDPAGPVTSPEVYAAAKSLNQMFNEGKVKAAQPDDNVGAGDGGSSGGENF